MYCYFGSLVSSLAELINGNGGPDRTTSIVIVVLSGVIIIGVVVFVTIIAKRAINKSLNAQQT